MRKRWRITSQESRWSKIEAAFEGAYPSEIEGIYGPGVKMYQFADTSLSEQVQTLAGTKMGFWENENEKYPINLDFKNKSVFYSEGVSTSGTETSSRE